MTRAQRIDACVRRVAERMLPLRELLGPFPWLLGEIQVQFIENVRREWRTMNGGMG